MQTTTVGSRGVLYSFDDIGGVNVYVIVGERRFYVCDTCTGSEPMLEVKASLEARFGRREYLVFNSHKDWDHIWGNAAFDGSLILAHSLTSEGIRHEWDDSLCRYARYRRGEVTMSLPNVIFDSMVAFPEDDIEFFYSPGHTIDSSSCFDHRDNVLFVGDNLEEPFPYLSQPDALLHLATLRRYRDLSPALYVPGHGNPAGGSFLESNAAYLDLLLQGRSLASPDPSIQARHRENIAVMAAGAGK